MLMEQLEYKNNRRIKNEIKKLYVSAFPKNERPPVHYFFKSALKESNRLIAYYIENEFIGFTYLSYYKDICYIFFLAVSDSKRNMGYGSKIIEQIKSDNSDYVLLLCYEEVDEKYVDYLNRKNREKFYLKNGFKNNELKTNEFGVIFQTAYIGKHKVKIEDYIEIFVLGFGELARKYIKEA